ncbi:MAG TPA: hypothetical protein VGY54_18345 [Polyangiaceae bacterium]|jgi:transposase|nr:hypothetical protein [Polyangiaceae bacterium]
MPYSEDFRRRAVELPKSGEWTTRELQELLGPAHTTVARWVRLEAWTGQVNDAPSNRGRDPRIDDDQLRIVRELVVWSKMKAWLRRLAARTFDVIGAALRDVDRVEACNFFENCGYHVA